MIAPVCIITRHQLRLALSVKVALLITTYNRPDALGAVLESVTLQTRTPDEVIVCDDGSTATTRSLIASWLDRLPICYAWVSDRQFRASMTRNLGILKSQSDLLIFVDGDCLMPPTFIETHVKLAQPGYVLSGGRFLCTRDETLSILKKDVSISSVFGNWKFMRWPLGPFRNLGSTRWKSVRTCNLSLHREDTVRIAGFDESYVGWGLEDSDFVIRLIHSGVQIRSGRLGVCVAHLHHDESSRDRLSINHERFQETLTNRDHILANSSILHP